MSFSHNIDTSAPEKQSEQVNTKQFLLCEI